MRHGVFVHDLRFVVQRDKLRFGVYSPYPAIVVDRHVLGYKSVALALYVFGLEHCLGKLEYPAHVRRRLDSIYDALVGGVYEFQCRH